MQDFRELKVWEKGHELVLAVYRSTATFPKAELFGLTSQMRRSAVSIPANVAEGCCRGGDTEFARFLQIAMASSSELKYYLMLAHDLEFMSAADSQQLIEQVNEVQKMLASLIRRLRAKS